MAKAGLPRQYDVGGPSQPTGRLQGKKPPQKKIQPAAWSKVYHFYFVLMKSDPTQVRIHSELLRELRLCLLSSDVSV